MDKCETGRGGKPFNPFELFVRKKPGSGGNTQLESQVEDQTNAQLWSSGKLPGFSLPDLSWIKNVAREKCQIGAFIFNPKIHVAYFGSFKQGFLIVNFIANTTEKYENSLKNLKTHSAAPCES